MEGGGDNNLNKIQKNSSSYSQPKVILLLDDEESYPPDQLLSLDAAGYLFKRNVTETLIHLVRSVAYGQADWFSRTVVEHLLEQHTNSTAFISQIREFDLNLTQRDITVIELMVSGYDNDDIARKLCLAPKTIRNRASLIYEKFGVDSRFALMRLLQNRQPGGHLT